MRSVPTRSTLASLALGALSGLVAVLALTLAQALLRLALGVSPPTELIGDRVAPLLGIERFFSLLELFGGYDQLKQFGVGSATLGQLALGVLLGAIYAGLVRRAAGDGDRRASRGPLLVLIGVVSALWVVSVVGLWPVLGTNYRGLAPGSARVLTLVATVVSSALFVVVLATSYRLLSSGSRASSGETTAEGSASRRAVVVGGLGAGLAIATGGVGTALFRRSTFSYDGLQLAGPGIEPITPNERFYVVTKNVIDPRVRAATWRLEIDGLVERPRSYDLDELRSLPSVRQETTMMCISNGVGGGLQSNAMWTGVPLTELLSTAGLQEGAVEVLVTAVDGYSDSVSIDKAVDPTTLVAYEMNGEALPERHGYPARILVPGLFGEKSVKWVTRVEVVERDVKGFYERQGWGPQFVVPTRARFTEPDLSLPLSVGTVTVLRGTAFAGDRGVTSVEVSTDDARTWEPAELEYSSSPLAWVLWRYDWLPQRAGDVPLLVRATDGNGDVQVGEARDIVPQGATGYHRVMARVQA